jgi:hypothetical protein
MGSKSTVKGCLIAIGVAILVVGITAAVLIGIGVSKYRRFRDTYTDTQAVPVPVAEVTEAEGRRLQRKAEALETAVTQGRAETFTLNETELNQFIATLPRFESLRGRVALRIEGDVVKATASIPLDMLPFPGLAGRYLNGEIGLDVECEHGRLEVYATEVVVRGQPLPEEFMSQLRGRNLAQDAADDPDVASKLRNIESIRVESGQVVVQTRQAN